jgi:hypothetical protein
MRSIAAATIILVLYNLVVFLLPFDKETVFFVSYGFTMVAFVVAGLAVYHAFKKPDAKSKFYGFPVARIGVIYLGVQLVLSLPFMIIGDNVEAWIPVLLFSIVLGGGLLGLIATELTSEEIVKQDVKLKNASSMMRSIQSKVMQLTTQCEEPMLKKLAEEIRYSDPVSHESIADAEADLSAAVDQIQQAVLDEDMESVATLSRQAMALVAERNRLCKLSKR